MNIKNKSKENATLTNAKVNIRHNQFWLWRTGHLKMKCVGKTIRWQILK